MKVLKCPNCGASAKKDELICSYCGSTIIKESSEKPDNLITNVKPEILSANIIKELSPLADIKSNGIFFIIFIVFFMCAWVSGCLYGGFSMINEPFMMDRPLIFTLIPFFMAAAGLSMFAFMISKIVKEYRSASKLQLYIQKIKELKFDEAYEIGLNNDKLLAGQMLIAFYHKKDIAAANQLALQYIPTENKQNPLIINMLNYLGYNTKNR